MGTSVGKYCHTADSEWRTGCGSTILHKDKSWSPTLSLQGKIGILLLQGLPSKTGGVCFMINNQWCSDVEIISTGCSPDLEHLMIRCQPYYFPREFKSVVLTSVYIPPHADTNWALDELYGVTDRTETSQSEAAFIVARNVKMPTWENSCPIIVRTHSTMFTHLFGMHTRPSLTPHLANQITSQFCFCLPVETQKWQTSDMDHSVAVQPIRLWSMSLL